MANRPIFPDTIKNAALDIENADGTTAQDLLTAGTNGCRVNNISVTSDDTAAIDLIINYNNLTTDYGIARITVPIGAGTDGSTPPVSILNATDMPFLAEDLSYYLEGSNKITIAAVTAAKKIQIVATYGDY